jgi:tetratricopeptide (TPR) repeat protein
VPEIALQAYENEIDQLVEQARYLEALAHIRYLLSQHPHYIGAYYLLGKTMLEADLPELALDMFRRALSADPEHQMARIGLGLAHERRNDLDAAIWNLERALELDPGSDDIAEELRRMYGRRDAVDLDYVPQTRGGLARLFLRGLRYGRAVDELRLLLQEEPARPDLMTSLAEAYWRNDQLVQASEMCQEILDKMPYNHRANLLLGTLWVNSGQEEGWIYLKRAEEADPNNKRAVAMFGAESLLEPQDVMLDRLVYDPDAIEVDRENAWFRRLSAASITVGISEAPPEMTESEVRLIDITASLESQIEIPDWLRDLGGEDEAEMADGKLGWMADIDLGDTSDALAGGLSGFVAAESVEVLDDTVLAHSEVESKAGMAAVQEDEPDAGLSWLDDLTSAEEFVVDEAEETPDWLRRLTGDVEAEDEMPLELEPELAGSETSLLEDDGDEELSLDWLTAFSDLTPTAAEVAVAAEADEAADFDELPDWLHDLQENSAAAGTSANDDLERVETEDLPDWMVADTSGSEVGAEALAAGEVPNWLAQMQAEGESEAADGDLLDWLAALTPTESGVAEVTDEEIELDGFNPQLLAENVEALESVLDADDTPDWLAGMQPEDQAEAGDGDIPDWLAALAPVEPSVAEVTDEGIELDGFDLDDTLDWLAGMQPEDQTEAGDGDIPDWLAALAPVGTSPAGVVEEEMALEGFERSMLAEEAEPIFGEDDGPPEWVLELQDIAGLPDIGEFILDEDAVDTSPDAGRNVDIEGDVDIPDWLKSFQPELLLEDEAEDADEGVPDWLQGLKPTVADRAEEVPEDDLADQDLSAWLALQDLGEENQTTATVFEEVAGPQEILPDDLRMGDSFSGSDALAWLDSLTVAEGAQVQPETDPVVEAPEAESDTLSGDDALSWLQSLTVGKEEELRARAQVESEARVAEILGRKREVPVMPEPEPTLVELEAELETDAESDTLSSDDALSSLEGLGIGVDAQVSVEADWETQFSELPDPAVEAPEAESDTLSSDHALSWLEGLGIGADEQVSVEADWETQFSELPDPVVEAPEAESDTLSGDDALSWLEGLGIGADEQVSVEADWETQFSELPDPVVGAPEAESDTLSGDDALSWLESLTIGKEEELRARAQVESEARVAEIRGRKREVPAIPESVFTAPEPETPSSSDETAKVAPMPMETGDLADRDGGDVDHGEDALTWLRDLTSEEEQTLRAQVEDTVEDEVEVEELAAIDLEEGFFGWVAFGGVVTEIVPAPVSRVPPVAPPASVEVPKPAAVVVPVTTPVVEREVAVKAPFSEPKLAEPVQEVSPALAKEVVTGPLVEPALPDSAEAVPVVSQPEPTLASESTPHEVAEKVATRKRGAASRAEPVLPEPVAASTPVDPVSEARLEELRALVKRKRSDHASRLELARLLFATGEVQESMENYARLIKSSARTDEVMEDLERYASENPQVTTIMRTLGDVYMKFGELDKALEIYNRAMNLL